LFIFLLISFWPFYCLSFFDLRLLITLLVSSNFYFLILSDIYTCYKIYWWLLIILLVSSNLNSFNFKWYLHVLQNILTNSFI
jgi:hypothetical protein